MKKYFFLIIVVLVQQNNAQSFIDVLNTVNKVMYYTEIASNLLSSEDNLEIYLSDKVHSEMIYNHKLSTSTWLTNIGNEIVEVCDRKTLPEELKYEFFIIESNEFNAFAAPGGKVYVTKALFDALDQHEMAFVLGHEIGHIVRKHSIRQIKNTSEFLAIKELALALMKKDDDFKNRLNTLANLAYTAVQASYSREWERDVDKYGVELAYKAGYEPHSSVDAIKKIKDATAAWGNLCFLWNTHPQIDERINYLEAESQNYNYAAKKTAKFPIVSDFSLFPDGNEITNCFKITTTGCDNNPYYKGSLRFLEKGSVMISKFAIDMLPDHVLLLVEHLSSKADNCNKNASPVTITINDNVVIKDYSPPSNDMITDFWDVKDFLKPGINIITWTAGDLCSHYWLKRWKLIRGY